MSSAMARSLSDSRLLKQFGPSRETAPGARAVGQTCFTGTNLGLEKV